MLSPKNLALLFVCTLLVPRSLSAQTDKAPGWTPSQMMNVPRVGSVQVSPDGKQVAYTVRRAVMDGDRSEYLTHIHLAGADGKQSVQLTRGNKSCDDPQWSPDGIWIAFVSQRGGKRNLWVISPRAGEARQISAVETGVISFRWSPDGMSLAFTEMDPLSAVEKKAIKQKNDARVVDENVKMARLYVLPFTAPAEAPAKSRLLTPDNYSVGGELFRAGQAPFDWSPDGKTIVFSHTKTPSPNDWPTADLSLLDVATGKIQPLVHTDAAESSPLYSPNGKSIAYAASDSPPTWPGRRRIHVISSSGGKARPLAETTDGFGRYSELIGWSADGAHLYFTEASGTNVDLQIMSAEGSGAPALVTLGVKSGVSLNAKRNVLGYAWQTLDSAPEAFISTVESKAGSHGMGKMTRVSSIQQPSSALPPLAKTEVISWKSSDGLTVEGLLTYPVGYEKGKRYPLLLVIHGGPMGVFTRTYDGSAGLYPIAAFASKGYAILRPNPRGSSGYGVKFRYVNHADWGGGDYRDIMAGVDQVLKMGVGDPDRMGVMGWSYGGYMTSWIITQTRRFKAASVGAGVTNLMSFTGTSDIPAFLPDYLGGEYWDNFDAYRKHSAMFHVKGVTTPTLIQHGARDERVPLSQGQELYNALKRQGCTTKMVIYPRTPHGIEEPRLLVDCMQRNLDWFDRYVRKVKPAGTK